MKFADHLKPGVSARIMTGHGAFVLGGKRDADRLEQIDDDEQILFIQTTVAEGREKGQKARVLLPYSAIEWISLPT
jgi:hypothetical protein